jgi:hypothetical protein
MLQILLTMASLSSMCLVAAVGNVLRKKQSDDGCIRKYIGFLQIMRSLESGGYSENWRVCVQKVMDHRNMPRECDADATVAELVDLINAFLKMRMSNPPTPL